MDSGFFQGYKRTCLKPNELLVSVLIPFTQEVSSHNINKYLCHTSFFLQHEFIYSYKQSRRREDDIAIVNAGLRVLLQPGKPHWMVHDCSLAYGGMSYITVMATKTQSALIGK